MGGLGVLIIKGAKTIVECNEKIYLHSFENHHQLYSMIFYFFL